MIVDSQSNSETQDLLPRRPREECGIFAVYGHEEAAKLAYFGLYVVIPSNIALTNMLNA